MLVLVLVGALVGTSVAGSMIGGDAIKEAKMPDCCWVDCDCE